MLHKCTVCTLGEVPYDEALSFQFELMERLRERKGKDSYLVLLEHPPVFTIGKNGNPRNILINEDTLRKKGIVVRQIDRGGDVTYHGPGQLVGYSIMSLVSYKKTVREYIAALEESLIRTLAAFGVTAQRRPKYIGVWVGEEKIGFIGVRVSRGITYHGFALNVNPDLVAFSYINPCGINGCKITSLAKLTNRPVTIPEVAREFVKCYSQLFNLTPTVVKTHLSYIPANLLL